MLTDSIHECVETHGGILIKALAGLVEDEHRRILHQCPREQDAALFAVGERMERPMRKPLHLHDVHPALHDHTLQVGELAEQPDRIEKPGCDDVETVPRCLKIMMKLRRHMPDHPLDVPYALSTALTPVEEPYIPRECLWIVAVDEAQQGRLPRAVGTRDMPAFTLSDFPVEPFEDLPFAVCHMHIFHPDRNGEIRMRVSGGNTPKGIGIHYIGYSCT